MGLLARRRAQYRTYSLSIHRWRAQMPMGPWEPVWVKQARADYYAGRDALDELRWRIGATNSGREFLRRTGAYGMQVCRSGGDRRKSSRGPDRRKSGNVRTQPSGSM